LFSGSLSAQDFDPTKPNYDLLKQLVIEKLNQKRNRKSKINLIQHQALQTTSDNYTRKLRASKLEKNSSNEIRISKKLKKNCKANGYRNAFVDYHITSLPCVNSKGFKFYYDREDTETNTHLFMGNRPTKKEKEKDTYKSTPIKLFSYNELADLIAKQFMKDDGSFKILNNGFDKFGFSIAVEQSTLYRNRLPKIKIIIILGGNRITW
jgi:hypothetical protein